MRTMPRILLPLLALILSACIPAIARTEPQIVARASVPIDRVEELRAVFDAMPTLRKLYHSVDVGREGTSLEGLTGVGFTLVLEGNIIVLFNKVIIDDTFRVSSAYNPMHPHPSIADIRRAFAEVRAAVETVPGASMTQEEGYPPEEGE